ncbi:MAG: hypothetical protein WCE94_01495 [Candidatus Methanoperedens sp.]
MRTIVTAKDVQDSIKKNSKLNEDKAYALNIKPDVMTLGVAGVAVAEPVPQKDDYKERVIKYIPAEVVAFYLFLIGIVNGEGIPSETKPLILWIIVVVGTVATWLYLLRVQNVHKIVQLIITTGAFLVWAFALGGPFVYLNWYLPAYGQLLLGVYTFLVGIIEPQS